MTPAPYHTGSAKPVPVAAFCVGQHPEKTQPQRQHGKAQPEKTFKRGNPAKPGAVKPDDFYPPGLHPECLPALDPEAAKIADSLAQ